MTPPWSGVAIAQRGGRARRRRDARRAELRGPPLDVWTPELRAHRRADRLDERALRAAGVYGVGDLDHYGAWRGADVWRLWVRARSRRMGAVGSRASSAVRGGGWAAALVNNVVVERTTVVNVQHIASTTTPRPERRRRGPRDAFAGARARARVTVARPRANRSREAGVDADRAEATARAVRNSLSSASARRIRRASRLRAGHSDRNARRTRGADTRQDVRATLGPEPRRRRLARSFGPTSRAIRLGASDAVAARASG